MLKLQCNSEKAVIVRSAICQIKYHLPVEADVEDFEHSSSKNAEILSKKSYSIMLIKK